MRYDKWRRESGKIGTKNACTPGSNSVSVALEITFGCVEDSQGQETAVIK